MNLKLYKNLNKIVTQEVMPAFQNLQISHYRKQASTQTRLRREDQPNLLPSCY